MTGHVTEDVGLTTDRRRQRERLHEQLLILLPQLRARLLRTVGDQPPKLAIRRRRMRQERHLVRGMKLDERSDRLWQRLASRFAIAVKRDARYLNWKYLEPPHVRYTAALLRRGEEVDGYVVYRHLREPQGRVTQIVDLLADPSDEQKLLDAMRRGKVMTVEATSDGGTRSRDVFSLAGVTASVLAIASNCS